MLLQYDAGLFLTFLLYLFVLVSLAVSLSVWEGRSISLCWKISWISVCLESWSLGPARHFSLLSPDWRQNCRVFFKCVLSPVIVLQQLDHTGGSCKNVVYLCVKRSWGKSKDCDFRCVRRKTSRKRIFEDVQRYQLL